MSTSLIIQYSGQDSTQSSPRVRLEQKPVPNGNISITDLQVMLSGAINGIPAEVYSSPSCPASVFSGQVSIPLTVWVWPSAIGLPYGLSAALGEVGPAVRIDQEREFDLVLDFSSAVDLPFLASSLDWAWSEMPCFNRSGEEVPRPPLVVTPTTVQSSGNFLGVIRIRCMAIGYQHEIVMTMDKYSTPADGSSTDGDEALVTWDPELGHMAVDMTNPNGASDDGKSRAVMATSDIKNSATVTWVDGAGATVTESIDLDIPVCAAALLAACPNGSLKQESQYGAVIDQQELIPVVYYNDCTGKVIGMRNEPAKN